MSFIVTAYVREGIVMAADSRLTLNAQKVEAGNITNLIAVGQSDSNQKLFLSKDGIGISTVGDAEINGIPIAGFIYDFVETLVNQNTWNPEITSDEIIKYFRGQPKIPNTKFHIAGYDRQKNEQHVWLVDLHKNIKTRINPNNKYGLTWAGEGDIIARILNPSAEVDQSNNIKSIYPNHQIPFQFFTLQDAIDFAVYAVRTTIDTIRFQPRPKSVGGPIDVLIIKPNESRWIQKKELRV